MLAVMDELTRECLALDVERRLNSEDVLDRLTELFVRRGLPAYIRSDNGAEFTANAVRGWLTRLGVRTLYIERGSPWENG
jgi:transposase InsO family protein